MTVHACPASGGAENVQDFKRVQAHTRYTLRDGTPVPGVTTILGVLAKPALIAWANRLGLQGIDSSKYVDVLSQAGTLAHSLAIARITGGAEPDLDTFTPEQVALARGAFERFLEWHAEARPKVVAAETPLVHESLQFGGTPDLIATLGRRKSLTVVDLKATRALHDDHAYQVAAYVHLAQANGYAIKNAMIVRIGRTPAEGSEIRTWKVAQLERQWQVFCHALEIYKLTRPLAREVT